MARKSKSKQGRGSGSGGRGSGAGRSKRPGTNRQFPRTARLNALLHEIVADYFERIDDDRFDLLTITGVEIDSDLNKAQVFVTTLETVISDDGASGDDDGADADNKLLTALSDYRKAVQRKIGNEARMRKTPEVVFAIDPGVRSGARIEEILAGIEIGPDDTNTTDQAEPQPEDEI